MQTDNRSALQVGDRVLLPARNGRERFATPAESRRIGTIIDIWEELGDAIVRPDDTFMAGFQRLSELRKQTVEPGDLVDVVEGPTGRVSFTGRVYRVLDRKGPSSRILVQRYDGHIERVPLRRLYPYVRLNAERLYKAQANLPPSLHDRWRDELNRRGLSKSGTAAWWLRRAAERAGWKLSPENEPGGRRLEQPRELRRSKPNARTGLFSETVYLYGEEIDALFLLALSDRRSFSNMLVHLIARGMNGEFGWPGTSLP